MDFLRRSWRVLALAIIAVVVAVFAGKPLVEKLAPVATEVVNAIPCTPGEVSPKCPAPAAVPAAQAH